MTDAEFRASSLRPAPRFGAELARLKALDWESMDPTSVRLEELRRGYIELLASMADGGAAGCRRRSTLGGI